MTDSNSDTFTDTAELIAYNNHQSVLHHLSGLQAQLHQLGESMQSLQAQIRFLAFTTLLGGIFSAATMIFFRRRF